MKRLYLCLASVLFVIGLQAQNPIIRDQFSADPSALVVGDRVFVFPSHDIPAPEDFPRKDWFCMADYHVFSSKNLIDWTDHGKIVDQKEVPWVNATSYSMWAPDCKEHDGKYYFFFPAGAKPVEGQRWGGGNRVGIAIADKPEGPYTPQENYMEGPMGIDPCIFVDDDGQGYLVMPGITITKMSEDWLSTDRSVSHRVEGVPTKGLVEGPYLFKANNKYYMTFPWARDSTEVLAYCMADNIFGPYEFKGVFFEEHPNGCWTNHHSVINFKGQWYLFYHHNDYSPNFDKNRSVCADSLFFNADGTIKVVKPTLRGIGITPSNYQIQLDRYSEIGGGAGIEYLNTDNYFEGWKLNLKSAGAFAQYNTVQFSKAPKSAKIMAKGNGVVALYQDGQKIGSVNISSESFAIAKGAVKGQKGIHHLKAVLESGSVEIDWVQF